MICVAQVRAHPDTVVGDFAAASKYRVWEQVCSSIGQDRLVGTDLMLPAPVRPVQCTLEKASIGEGRTQRESECLFVQTSGRAS